MKKGTETPVDITTIPEWINSIPQSGWYWIDLYVTLSLAKLSQPVEGAWAAYDIV